MPDGPELSRPRGAPVRRWTGLGRPLRHPDLLLLQEMDRPGAAWIADALGMSWVFYPALFHPRRERDFGNSVLSR